MPEETILDKKRKEKPKKAKKPKNKNNKNLLGMVFAIIVAIGVFVGLTSYQATVLSDYEKVVRVVAIKDVPNGMAITANNVSQYFAEEEIEAKHDVNSPVETLDSLVDFVSNTKIAKGQTASFVNFVSKKHLLAGITDMTYISFTVSKAGDALGGTIREGNVIDVNVATINDGVINAGTSLYVNAVYDSGYVKLSESDTAPALTIEVALDSKDAEQFIEAINNGTPYVSRRQ